KASVSKGPELRQRRAARTSTMAIWRLAGECPSDIPEELEAQSFDGWNPWRERSQPTGDYILVPDPADPSRHLWVEILEVEGGETRKRFARASVSCKSYFWVPASDGA